MPVSSISMSAVSTMRPFGTFSRLQGISGISAYSPATTFLRLYTCVFSRIFGQMCSRYACAPLAIKQSDAPAKPVMALDFNGIKLLLWARNLGTSFHRTLTLGRQGFACSPAMFRSALRDFGVDAGEDRIERCLRHPPCEAHYADEFF